MVLVASEPPGVEGLLGAPPTVPLSDGEVGGDAAGLRSLGLSPTGRLWFESVHPAATPVMSASAKSPERSLLILRSLLGARYPLI
jgi:hypothetical protein